MRVPGIEPGTHRPRGAIFPPQRQDRLAGMLALALSLSFAAGLATMLVGALAHALARRVSARPLRLGPGLRALALGLLFVVGSLGTLGGLAIHIAENLR